jgi:hypothetical protein
VTGHRFSPLRVWRDEDGTVAYVARDRFYSKLPFPEHAEYRDGRIRWVRHVEGGQMRRLAVGEDYPRAVELLGLERRAAPKGRRRN